MLKQTQIHLTRLKLTAAVLGLGLTASGALAGAFKPTDVPADAKWVVHLDVDAARKSSIAQTIQDRLMQRDDVKQGVSDIETLTGVQVPDDVSDVTLYGSEFGEKNNIVLMSGKFDRRRILGVVSLSPQYTSTKHGAHEVVSWEDKGQINYGGFHGERRLIIARSKENVVHALDVLDQKVETLKGVSDFGIDAKDATVSPASAMLYVGGMNLGDLPGVADASPLFQQAKSAVVLLGEEGGQAYMKGLVKAVDADKAEQMARAAEGLRSLVQLGASQREADRSAKLTNELLQTLKIDRVDEAVVLDWKAPAQTVMDLLEEGLLKQQVNADGAGVKPRQAPAN